MGRLSRATRADNRLNVVHGGFHAGQIVGATVGAGGRSVAGHGAAVNGNDMR